MKLAALLVASVLAVGVLWLAGEQHRENCISAGRTGCSVLPWVEGKEPPKATRGKLTPAGCALLKLGNRTATSTAQIQPEPPECR